MKFKRGDIVKIRFLPNYMSHFFIKEAEYALVEYSYGKRYGSGKTKDNDEYSLMYWVPDYGWTTSAWYPTSILELYSRGNPMAFEVLDNEGDS